MKGMGRAQRPICPSVEVGMFSVAFLCWCLRGPESWVCFPVPYSKPISLATVRKEKQPLTFMVLQAKGLVG